jgi:hypothetical protein
VENSSEFLGKTIFQNFFRRKFHFFPNIFGGKIFRGIFPEIFPGKNVRKIGPSMGEFSLVGRLLTYILWPVL